MQLAGYFEVKMNCMFKSIYIMVSDEKLYWSDSYMNTISYIGLDGNNRGELTHDPRADIMHIAVYGSHLYYTAVNRQ